MGPALSGGFSRCCSRPGDARDPHRPIMIKLRFQTFQSSVLVSYLLDVLVLAASSNLFAYFYIWNRFSSAAPQGSCNSISAKVFFYFLFFYPVSLSEQTQYSKLTYCQNVEVACSCSSVDSRTPHIPTIVEHLCLPRMKDAPGHRTSPAKTKETHKRNLALWSSNS